MATETIGGSIQRLQREIAALNRQGAAEARKEAARVERIAQINAALTEATSAAVLGRRQRRVAALEQEIVAIRKRRAEVSRAAAERTAELHRQQQALYREQKREHRALVDRLQRRDRDALLRGVQASPALPRPDGAEEAAAYDAFISHATEDQAAVARPLAERLAALGFAVWYSETCLQVGDSLRRSIDAGLARARFGIVVLSPAFLARGWPQYELDGLVAREMAGGKVILPLWHGVGRDEVARYSPTLADRLALSTATASVEEIAGRLAAAMAPAGG